MNRFRPALRLPRSLRPPRARRRALGLCLAGVLAGTLAQAPAAQARSAPPEPAPCPAGLADNATCYTGTDANGAHYAIAVPKRWNGSLVVHAHGGPDLGDASDPARSVEDLERWQVVVDQGYAWAGSSYRRGGYGTRMAAADTESVRRLFVEEFGRPLRTYVHGQSWGGDVAAKVVETYAGPHGPYDGALLTNGVLAGGSRGYDYRVDLRVVYQYYCANLPRPEEPRYPLWQGPAPRLDADHGRAACPPPGVHRPRLPARGAHRSPAAQPGRHPQRHGHPGADAGVAPALLGVHLPGHRARAAGRP